MSYNNRLKSYASLSAKLTSLSDDQLSDMISKANYTHSGVGGHAVLLKIGKFTVFVKKIALTDLEKQPQNIMSTSNIFELPLFYQYGVGSTGFGVWRELNAHIMTTNWVLSKECPHFPLLYHWRVLPHLKQEPVNTEQMARLTRDVKYWENSPTVRNRLEAIQNASTHIVLFLEYVPQTLHQWLEREINEGKNRADTAILFVDKILKEINNFTNTRGFMHFDGHFENILTDGKFLYFTDFGLALSSEFDLTQAELEFLKIHRTYDRCSSIVNLLHCVITTLYGKENWEKHLRVFLKNEQNKLSPSIVNLISQYALVALVMDEFYRDLQKKSKETPYPREKLEELLAVFEKNPI